MMNRSIRIGLVVPFAEDRVPNEGPIMYPHVTFIPHGTGVGSLTPEGYDQAFYKIVPAADNLAKRGVDAIMVIGTSLDLLPRPRVQRVSDPGNRASAPRCR